LNASIIQAQRNSRELAVLFIDLDNFKSINDSYGHHQGDLFLVEIAKCLQKNVRESDTVARLSGDEFAIIIEELSTPEDAAVVVQKLIDALSKPIDLDEVEVELSASIGISVFPRDGQNADDLVRCADTAMYRVKHTTKGDYCFYSD
jgi:diguanylate cyclase (GGDEF)-like protein